MFRKFAALFVILSMLFCTAAFADDDAIYTLDGEQGYTISVEGWAMTALMEKALDAAALGQSYNIKDPEHIAEAISDTIAMQIRERIIIGRLTDLGIDPDAIGPDMDADASMAVLKALVCNETIKPLLPDGGPASDDPESNEVNMYLAMHGINTSVLYYASRRDAQNEVLKAWYAENEGAGLEGEALTAAYEAWIAELTAQHDISVNEEICAALAESLAK